MMLLSEVASAVNGQMIGPDVLIESVGTDSRQIVSQQLFVALKGERFDGNLFAEKAIHQGASAVLICDHTCSVSPAVLVKDTRLALGHLAQYWRQKMPAKLVAITGSNGKTTTKEMLSEILTIAAGGKAKVNATIGNLNNDIGLPLTILKTREQHEYVIAEMGMNHLGEIEYLSQIAKPNVAVINNAGTAHIGELGSRENIAKAKGEIYSGLAEGGIAVINADDRFADYWYSLNKARSVIRFGFLQKADITATAKANAMGHLVKLVTPSGNVEFQLNVLGQHNLNNALAASAAAIAIGIKPEAIAKGLAEFSGVNGRLQYKVGINGAQLIDDTYNANPDSMKAAIDVLVKLNKPHIFVMGDMGELGQSAAQMHAEIGAYAKENGIKKMLAFGELSQQAILAYGGNGEHFANLEDLITSVKSQMNQETVVLIKGSRFMRMERVVDVLQVPINNNQAMGETTCC